MVCTVTAFATLAGPPTASAIIQGSGGTYTWAQLWAGAVMLVGAMVVAAGRIYLVGFKLRIKI